MTAGHYGVVRRRIEAFYPDQIVVDLKDEALLRHELSGLGIKVEPIESSKGLGLSLYGLVGVAEAVTRLGPDLEQRVRARAAGGYEPGEAPTPLDLLLFHLRETSAQKHAGYQPIVAKNRVYENIEGSPYSGGSAGDPNPVAAFELPARSDGPRRRPRIGVFDTPMYPHEGLAGRYVIDSPRALLSPRPEWVSFSGHAVFVASVAARQAPDADFVIYPVLDAERLVTTSWTLATRLVQSLDDDLDFMIIALGSAAADGREPLTLARACERTSGVVKVAALGNHGQAKERAPAGAVFSDLPANIPMWPAASSTVIAVGAKDKDGLPAYFSPTPEEAPWTDCLAPGVDLPGLYLPGVVRMADLHVPSGKVVVSDRQATFPRPGHATWSGSSFAAAYTAGYLAHQAYIQGIDAGEAADRLLSGQGVVKLDGFADSGIEVVRPRRN